LKVRTVRLSSLQSSAFLVSVHRSQEARCVDLLSKEEGIYLRNGCYYIRN